MKSAHSKLRKASKKKNPSREHLVKIMQVGKEGGIPSIYYVHLSLVGLCISLQFNNQFEEAKDMVHTHRVEGLRKVSYTNLCSSIL